MNGTDTSRGVTIAFLLALAILAGAGIFFADWKITQTRAKDKEAEISVLLKKSFSAPDGRVLSEPEKTTSESQSYMMLIAVLEGDRPVFLRTWKWTEENMARGEDNLFSWVWANGSIQDRNSATDADQDIALALIFAHRTWGDPENLLRAKAIIADIWDKETAVVSGTRYVAAGNWALGDPTGLVLNPSYFAPSTYRIFAQVDTDHDWMGLVDSSYEALAACSRPRGIPANWCKINPQGDVVEDFERTMPNAGVYSYDSIRIPFRSALDREWFGERRALHFGARTMLFRDWNTYNKIFAVYTDEGFPAARYESFAGYGADLAYFSLTADLTAQRIFKEKIADLRTQDLPYYDLCWLWFGLHFFNEHFRDAPIWP